MRCFQISILAAALGVVIVALPTPAAATTKDEAKDMCVKRGPQCKSMGLGQDPYNDLLICVDNRSTGQGVQCVRCQGNNPCSVLREVPTGQKPGLTAVEAVLTESVRPADTSALEERIRTLEERVKALENRK
jgi:hypothetical protein